jgi:hypothetical protein
VSKLTVDEWWAAWVLKGSPVHDDKFWKAAEKDLGPDKYVELIIILVDKMMERIRSSHDEH